jgi:hypothetical protein
MSEISESVRRVGGQGSHDLLKAHPGARHQSEFKSGIKVVGIANIGAEKHLASGLRESMQLAYHFVDPLLPLLVGSAAFTGLEIE